MINKSMNMSVMYQERFKKWAKGKYLRFLCSIVKSSQRIEMNSENKNHYFTICNRRQARKQNTMFHCFLNWMKDILINIKFLFKSIIRKR